jgi:hypothetical protein
MACLVEIVSIVARPVVFVFMRDPSITAQANGREIASGVPSSTDIQAIDFASCFRGNI